MAKESVKIIETDVLIVGSGPAGYSAAIYTSRAGKETVIITGKTKGGLITTTGEIDNYLGLPDSNGIEMAKIFESHAKKFGAKQAKGEIISIVKEGDNFISTLDSGRKFTSKAVIYATGSDPRKLGVPGEDLSGVSYCSTCDGLMFENERVIVVGGGETAVEDALYLSQICKSVDVLVRGSSFRATAPAVQKLVNQPNVNVHMISSISEILGEDGAVKSVRLVEGGVIQADGVFIAVGQIPNSELAVRCNHVETFENNFIKGSKTPGFFIAGDVTDSNYRQVIIAAGDGAKAGIDATSYLNTL